METDILCLVTLFPENRAFYEMWKNTLQPDRPQMTLHGACALHAG